MQPSNVHGDLQFTSDARSAALNATNEDTSASTDCAETDVAADQGGDPDDPRSSKRSDALVRSKAGYTDVTTHNWTVGNSSGPYLQEAAVTHIDAATSPPATEASTPSCSSTTATVKRTLAQSLMDKAGTEIRKVFAERHKRDVEETKLLLEDIIQMIDLWQNLATMYKNDPPTRAYCEIRVYELTCKVHVCEQGDREDELTILAEEMTSSMTVEAVSLPNSPVFGYRWEMRRAEREQADQMRAQEALVRSKARMEERAKRELTKEVLRERKNEAAQAFKADLKFRHKEKHRQDRERIEKARAKVRRGRSLPILTLEAESVAPEESGVAFSSDIEVPQNEKGTVEVGTKRRCDHCGLEHATIRDWKKCVVKA